MSIATSDSRAGAGIQALRPSCAVAVYGTTVATTAQNTVGVTGVHAFLHRRP